MAGKKTEHGITGLTAAQNMRRLREAQRLGYAEMSRLLEDLGRAIPPLGLRRIESGERRVDVDDLVAIAVVLGISPITLLMPDTPTADTPVVSTATPNGTDAEHLWSWLMAKDPIGGSDTTDTWLDFAQSALPEWRRREVETGLRKFAELDQIERDIAAGGSKKDAAVARLRAIQAEYGDD